MFLHENDSNNNQTKFLKHVNVTLFLFFIGGAYSNKYDSQSFVAMYGLIPAHASLIFCTFQNTREASPFLIPPVGFPIYNCDNTVIIMMAPAQSPTQTFFWRAKHICVGGLNRPGYFTTMISSGIYNKLVINIKY